MYQEGEVRETMKEAIRTIQTASGRQLPPIGPTTVPLRDIDGFDSLNAIEVGAVISEAFGTNIDDNPFYDEKTRRLRNLDQAASFVLGVLREEGHGNSSK